MKGLDLSSLLANCACGRPHRLGTRTVHVGSGVLEGVSRWIPATGAREGPILLLADPDTHDAAGSRVAALLKRDGRAVREVVLTREPKADDRTLEELRGNLACGPSRIVAVGSGTLSDLGKSVAAVAGVPLCTVGTAASMNGYTSAIVALTVGGLKVTRPAPPPDVLVLDTSVLASAPPRMARAGFGDLCSKPVSGSDWILSAWIEDRSVCTAALTLADGAVARARSHAEGIGRALPDSVEVLAEALVASGWSMSVAGESSPASGGEHLLSHYLDISAEGWGRKPRLHGEQVAVGTRVSLALYRHVRRHGPPGHATTRPPEESDAERAARHAHLSAGARAALLAEARKKDEGSPQRDRRLLVLADGWASLWERLEAQLAAAEGLEEDLAAAGVPRTFSDIGVERGRAVELIRIARHMRARYTVLDLAADMGYLDRWSEEIVHEMEGVA